MTRSKVNDFARISLSAALLAALPALALDSAAAPLGAKVLKVGVMLSDSGDLKAYGTEMRRGIELAAKDFSILHGDKARLELVYVDDASKVEEASRQAELLLRKHRVSVVIGPSFLVGASVSASLLENAGIPFVLPLARAPAMATGKHTRYLRVEERRVGEAMAIFAKQTLKAKSVVLVNDAVSDTSKRFNEAFGKSFRGTKNKVLATLNFVGGGADAAKLLTEIAKLKADAVALPTTSFENARAFLDPAVAAGVHAIFLGSSSWALHTPDAKAPGPIGHFFGDVFASDAPEAREFVEAFRKAHAVAPSALAALSYEAASVVGQAFAEAKFSSAASSIHKSLATGKKFRSLTGDLSFRSDGTPSRPVLVLETTRSGLPRFREAIRLR